MARNTNPLKERFSDAPEGGQQPFAGSVPASLHLLVQGRRPIADYYLHEYELVVWESAGIFVAEMHSRMAYDNHYNSGIIGQPWSTREIFTTLLAARQRLRDMQADPVTHGALNRPNSVSRYWDARSYGVWTGGRRQQRDTTPQTVRTYERPTGIENGRLAAAVASGQALPIDDPAAGELVRTLWGRREAAARAAVMRFAAEAPFTFGHWSHWKWLYKQAEAMGDTDLLAVMIARIDGEPLRSPTAFSWLAQRPSVATLAYMKRRARRALDQLAGRDPARYVTLATEILIGTGRGKTELDPICQWIAYSIMYGQSGFYAQHGHGRGRYVRRGLRIPLITQHESAPDAWTARADLLLLIYTDPGLPWQMQEWAIAALLRRGVPLPALEEAILGRFLTSNSPLLIRTAVDQVNRRNEPNLQLDPALVDQLNRRNEPNFPIAPALAARAFYYANGAQRRQFRTLLETSRGAGTWAKDFAVTLCDLVGRGAAARLAARQIDCATLLAERFARDIPAAALRPLIPALLATGREEFMVLVRTALARVRREEIPALLAAGEQLPAVIQRRFVELLVESVRSWSLNREVLLTLVTSQSTWTRSVTWRLIRALPALNAWIFDWLWLQVFSSSTPAVTLVGVIASPDALYLLPAVHHKALGERLAREPALLAYATPESLPLLLERFPLETVLDWTASMAQPDWDRLRPTLLQILQGAGLLSRLWHALLEMPAANPVAARLLADPEVVATFAASADASFLETSNPIFGPLLVRWMSGRLDFFGPGSRPLLAAATHKLPEVRAWALQRLDAVGTTTPFALRLLESGLPEPMDRGRRHFDAVPRGDAQELDFALALCDSPDTAVQAYGREYLQHRQETLPAETLTRRLAEHPDPPMQTVVAARLLQEPVQAPEVRAFDAAVLRARNRGRRPKELIKQRLADTSPAALDAATMLEMARSNTPRDAEWALQQLARMAMAGEPVEGLELGGVGGI